VNHEITTFDPAELSTHYVLGLEHLFSNGITMRIEGYYKDISRVSSNYQNLRDPWEVFPEARNDEIRLDFSGATSKGVELFLKYDVGSKVSWWFSYALARAEETITNIEYAGLLDVQTGTLPRINNQEHTVYLDVNYKPTKKWNFNVSFQYYQGLPQTIYDYDFQTLNGENGSVLPLHFFPRHLTFRGLQYPAYHRMDVRTNRMFELQNSRIVAYVHLVNVFGRENQRKFDLDVGGPTGDPIPDGSGGYIYPRDDTTWFGFLPIIGMSWEF